MTRPLIPVVACLLLLCPPALAPDAPAAEAVAPFVDQQVVAVAHVDLEQIDIAAAIEWLAQRVEAADFEPEMQKQTADDMRAGIGHAGNVVAQLREAGARHLYAIVGLDLVGGAPVALILPVEEASQQAVREQLEAMELQTRTIRGAVVAADMPQMLDRIERMEPADRADIAEALQRVDPAPMRMALAPSPQVRRVFEQMSPPNLPPQIGGQPTAVLTRGVQQAGLALRLPPQGRLELVVQSADAQAAMAMRDLYDKLVQAAMQAPDAPPAMARAFDALRPQIEENRLRISLDAASVDRLGNLLVPSILQARMTAMRVRSASNMRQLLIGVMMYAQDHKGAPPERLQDLREYLGGPRIDAVLTNPLQPHRGAESYIYIPPHEGHMSRIQDAAERLVIYEAFDEWPGGVNVGFADGHVEFIADQVRFEALLEIATEP